MTNFYVTYTLADEKAREGFLTEVDEAGIGEKSGGEDGCIRYEFFLPVKSDNTIFLFEQWESREAQKIHMQQPHFRVLSRIKEKYEVQAEILTQDVQ